MFPSVLGCLSLRSGWVWALAVGVAVTGASGVVILKVGVCCSGTIVEVAAAAVVVGEDSGRSGRHAASGRPVIVHRDAGYQVGTFQA